MDEPINANVFAENVYNESLKKLQCDPPPQVVYMGDDQYYWVKKHLWKHWVIQGFSYHQPNETFLGMGVIRVYKDNYLSFGEQVYG